MSTLPTNPSKSFIRANPHIYGIPDTLKGATTPMFEPPPKKRLRQSSKPLSAEERLNKTEREFLARLKADVYGRMQWIGIQCITLQIAFDTRYTPDFATRMEFGDFRFWEVKGGFIREDSIIKLRTAARMFPWWTFIKAQKKDGEWIEEIVCQ